jgi:outer membrane murein-binding lipoprotein Lpp
MKLTMLSQSQQRRVWEGMLSAEIRACYFADLSRRLQSRQKLATWAVLLFSSGAAAAALASLPEKLLWLRPTLPIITAGLSGYSIVTQNQKSAVDAADLHARWNRLAKDYEAIWENVYAADAPERLVSLDERATELSKTGATLPYKKRVMLKWENHVVQHRMAHAA